MGYAVRGGERSHIRVWAPCPPSKRKLQAWRDAGADPSERPRTYFRLEAVFAQTQVEPLPAPAQPVPLDPPFAEVQGDTLAWARGPLENWPASSATGSYTGRSRPPTAARVTRRPSS
jgi:hypothetical protein